MRGLRRGRHRECDTMNKELTNVRAARMPVEYEDAVRSLAICLTLDEARLWSDKADALQAWARIYRNDEAGRKARQLKLHAYRRMGQLAEELRPQQRKRRADGKIMGKKDGPASLLREQGVSGGYEFAATKLGRLPETEFQGLIDRPRVPSPMAALRVAHSGNEGVELSQVLSAARGFRSACKKISPDIAARFLSSNLTASQKQLFEELLDWLDRLDQCLTCEAERSGSNTDSPAPYSARHTAVPLGPTSPV